jgi:RNA polymerase sigma-70 factor (ECF subfamily)
MSLPHDEFAHLFAEAKSGSKDALSELLSQYQAALHSNAKPEMSASLAIRYDPADVVQDILIVAADAFSAFHGRSELELVAWLRRILIHQVQDAGKEAHRLKRDIGREIPLTKEIEETLEAKKEQNCEEKERQNVEQKELTETFWQLPEQYQEIIMLRFMDKRSFAEIAEVMCRSTNAVKKLCGRALQLWRKRVKFVKGRMKPAGALWT